MEEKFYKDEGLLLLKQENHCKLLKVAWDNTVKGVLRWNVIKTLLQNQLFIKVYPEEKLIVASSGTYDFDGNLLCDSSAKDVKIVCRGLFKLLVFQQGNMTNAVLLYKQAVLLRESCDDVVTAKKYFAIYSSKNGGHRWYVYNYRGRLMNEDFLPMCRTIKLCGEFLVVSGIGNYNIYSMYRRKVVRQGQFMVLCDKDEKFILTLNLQGTAEVFTGKWCRYPHVEGVGIVDGASLYFLQKNKRKYLYDSQGRLLEFRDAVNGVDDIAYDQEKNQLLAMVGKHIYEIQR